MPTLIKTKYAYETHSHPGIHFGLKDKSLTNQADMDAADINKIMARYEKTGLLVDNLGVERKPMYGDFTELRNYHETLSAIRNVERAFGLLPAALRNRFENDPQKLIAFLDNPENDKEAFKLGLKNNPEPVVPENPVPAPPAPATPPASPTP